MKKSHKLFEDLLKSNTMRRKNLQLQDVMTEHLLDQLFDQLKGEVKKLVKTTTSGPRKKQINKLRNIHKILKHIAIQINIPNDGTEKATLEKMPERFSDDMPTLPSLEKQGSIKNLAIEEIAKCADQNNLVHGYVDVHLSLLDGQRDHLTSYLSKCFIGSDDLEDHLTYEVVGGEGEIVKFHISTPFVCIQSYLTEEAQRT